MKKIISVLCVIMAMLAGSSCLAAQTDVRTGMHFDYWTGNNDSTGTQLYIPVQASATYRDCSLELLSAYIYTQVDPGGDTRYSLSQIADTKLNLSCGIFNRLPVEVLFGLGFNLPTGHNDLSRDQMVLIVPPDLFSIPTFGEGFNINPTITVAKEWNSLIAGLGVGYTWRGKYDYNYQYPDYDPGDVLTVTGEVGYDFTPDLFGKLFGQYIHYGEDKVDGDDFYQEGTAKVIGTGLSYNRQVWDLSVNITGILRDKSKVRDTASLLTATEDRNSHGNELDTLFTYRYHLDSNTTLRPSLDLLYIAENDYPSDSAFYVGKRTKATLGFSFDKAYAGNVKSSVGIGGFIMKDDKNWFHPGENVTYKGLSLQAQISKGF